MHFVDFPQQWSANNLNCWVYRTVAVCPTSCLCCLFSYLQDDSKQGHWRCASPCVQSNSKSVVSTLVPVYAFSAQIFILGCGAKSSLSCKGRYLSVCWCDFLCSFMLVNFIQKKKKSKAVSCFQHVQWSSLTVYWSLERQIIPHFSPVLAKYSDNSPVVPLANNGNNYEFYRNKPEGKKYGLPSSWVLVLNKHWSFPQERWQNHQSGTRRGQGENWERRGIENLMGKERELLNDGNCA